MALNTAIGRGNTRKTSMTIENADEKKSPAHLWRHVGTKINLCVFKYLNTTNLIEINLLGTWLLSNYK